MGTQPACAVVAAPKAATLAVNASAHASPITPAIQRALIL
jgi:hypothetical protein